MDSQSAICPWTESSPAIKVLVGDRNDRVEVTDVPADVRGGDGGDVLIGDGDELFGDSGNDTLLGRPGSWDRLHGGPGRDRMQGRGAGQGLTDEFYDDESDEQAARDVVSGGTDADALIDYSMRTRPLQIDLRRDYSGPERDIISGIASVTGGAGADVLIGNGRTNRLSGGNGDDRLHGLGGDDLLNGGLSNDLMSGGDGADRLTESPFWGSPGGGTDRFIGAPAPTTLRHSTRPTATRSNPTRFDATRSTLPSRATQLTCCRAAAPSRAGTANCTSCTFSHG